MSDKVDALLIGTLVVMAVVMVGLIVVGLIYATGTVLAAFGFWAVVLGLGYLIGRPIIRRLG